MGKVPPSQFLLAVLLLCSLLLGFTAVGQGAIPDAENDLPEGWKFFPRIGIDLEYGGYVVHQDNYASRLRRHLEMDLLQYRRHIFYMEFDEEHFFGIPANKWQFSVMKYNIILGGYRYDFGDYYLGAFVYHQCNNILLTSTYLTSKGREKGNLYGVGGEFLTKNMLLGKKDRGINFDSPKEYEFLGRWGAEFSTTKLYSTIRYPISWLIKGQARYDILRYKMAVPYLEVTGQILAGPDTRAVPSVEIGTRFHFARFDLTPFFKWSRDQESLVVNDFSQKAKLVAKNYLYGGARIELSGCPSSWCTPPGAGLQFLPELHGQADYGLYLNSPISRGYGNMELDLEALRWHSWTLFLYTDMNFNTRKEDYKPDKINYWLQYGLTYAGERYFMEGFVKNAQRLDSDVFHDMERSNLAGLRAGSRGMKPGHYNDGISFAGPTLAFINNWNAQASFGHFFNNRDWQYLWNIEAQVRWDPVRWRFVVPYVQAEVNWQSGGGSTPDTVEYSFEPGLRFHGTLDFVTYYRFQHRENREYFRGPAATESLIGIRVLF